MGLRDSRSFPRGLTDVDLVGIGGFPFDFRQNVLHFLHITSRYSIRVTTGRKWPELVAYRRCRGRLGIPGRLAGIYGGVGPVHPVVGVDLSGSLRS